jgi:hypothetical protein
MDHHLRIWMKWFPRSKPSLPAGPAAQGSEAAAKPAASRMSVAGSLASSKGKKAKASFIMAPTRGHLQVCCTADAGMLLVCTHLLYWSS